MLFISLTAIFYGFIALITLFTVYFVIIPYLKLLSFKKQGYATYFFPLLGTFRKYQLDFRNTGDCSTTTKESWKTSADEFYYTSIGGDVALVLRGPKYLRQFLLNQHLYKKSKFTSALSVMGNGLVTSEGDVWKRHRKIISSMFNYDFLKMNTKIIQDTVKEFIDNIRPNEYANYSVLNRIQDITAEVVGRIFFGENLTQYNYEGKPLTIFLGEIMIEFSICSRTPLIILFGPKMFHFSWISQYKKLMQKVTSFRAICLKIINDRKAHPQKNNDLLGLLLSTQNAEDPEQRFSDDDIIDEFITFFVAGMDTTGHTTCMALYNLAQNPKYLDEIKQERDQTYNTEKVVTADTLQKMNVLHSVVKETLRLHTPSPGFAPREALVDHKLSDLTIKKGQLIFFELLASFYSEKYYDKPYEFNPERWKTEPRDDSYAFVPFSGGARNCIGQHLALMESKIIISEFCEKFDFKVKDGYKLRMIIRLAYEPYDELIFQLSPKKNK